MSHSVLLKERATQHRQDLNLQDVVQPSFFAELIRTTFVMRDMSTAASVLFTAPYSGCGVSYVCSCVAAELACEGGKVLLADAAAIAALADRNTDRDRAVALCEQAAPGGAWVLGSRQISALSAEWPDAQRQTPSVILDALAQEFTHIVIDAPAISVSDVALRLATCVDGSILVAEAGRTEKRQMQALHRKFVSLGARVFGSVYNAY